MAFRKLPCPAVRCAPLNPTTNPLISYHLPPEFLGIMLTLHARRGLPGRLRVHNTHYILPYIHPCSLSARIVSSLMPGFIKSTLSHQQATACGPPSHLCLEPAHKRAGSSKGLSSSQPSQRSQRRPAAAAAARAHRIKSPITLHQHIKRRSRPFVLCHGSFHPFF